MLSHRRKSRPGVYVWLAVSLTLPLLALSASEAIPTCPHGTVFDPDSSTGRRCSYTLGILVPVCDTGDDDGGSSGSSCDFWARRLAAALLAVEHVNSETAVSRLIPQATSLPAGFRLKPVIINSGFHPSRAVDAVLEARTEGFVALVGPSRSEVALPVATIGHALHWPMVSYGATCASLSDRKQFPYFFRTAPTLGSSGRGMAGVIKHYGWTKAAVVFPQDEWGIESLQVLVHSLAENGHKVDLHRASYLSGDRESLREALRGTADSGSRLIIALLLETDTEEAIEMADALGIIGPDYVWFGTEVSYAQGLPSLESAAEDNPAAEQKLERQRQLLQGALRLTAEGNPPKWGGVDSSFKAIADSAEAFKSSALASNTPPYTAAMFTEEFFLGGLLGHVSNTPAYAYDAVWAAAFAIAANHSTWQAPLSDEQASSVDDVAVRGAYDKLRAESITAAMMLTDFDGVSGRIRFEANGDRLIEENSTRLSFTEFDSSTGRYIPIGYYDLEKDAVVLERPVVWSDNLTRIPEISSDEPDSAVPRSVFIVGGSVTLGLLAALVIGVLLYLRRRSLMIKARLEVSGGFSKGPPTEGSQVTLAITDIQGSTTLWDNFPHAMAHDVKLHHQVLRSLLHKTGGYEIATEGDSFKCAFHTPEDAVVWASLVQLNLLVVPWSPELENGGHDLLSCQSDWATIGNPTISPAHQTAIDAPRFRPTPALAAVGNEQLTTIPPVFPPLSTKLGPELSEVAHKFPNDTVTLPSGGTFTKGSPVFRGLRVRIGIHTGIAEKVSIHSSTKRHVYDGTVAVVANSVSDIPCGGQIVMSGETLAAIGNVDQLSARLAAHCREWIGSDTEAGICVMHMGRHQVLKEGIYPSLPHESIPINGLSVAGGAQRQSSLRRFESAPFDPPASVMKPTRKSFSLPRSGTTNSPVVRTGTTPGTTTALPTTAPASPPRKISPHVVMPDMELIQVVPVPLRARAKYFPPPTKTLRQLSPPFSDAPTAEGATIVFSWVEQLTELKQWDDKLMAGCVSQFSELLRGLLRQHGGYEVECEGGNMLSAFADPVAAVRWALAVQMGLLSMRWPQRLMLHRAAAEQYDPDTQKTVFIGLRAGIGMCTGNAEVMQPCPRTGRAEYFGPLMNHAARVAYAASGGQVLVHERTWVAAASRLKRDPAKHCFPNGVVTDLGTHALKGIREAVRIYQVMPPSLRSRTFPPIKTKSRLSSVPHNNSAHECDCDSDCEEDGASGAGKDEDANYLGRLFGIENSPPSESLVSELSSSIDNLRGGSIFGFLTRRPRSSSVDGDFSSVGHHIRAVPG